MALFLTALFFANNAAAGVLACVSGLLGQGQPAIHVIDARAGEPACPQADEPGPCLPRYLQNHKCDEHAIWGAAPAALFVPAFELPLFRAPAQAQLVVLASAQAVVGPPLTILYGNLRN